MGPGAGTLGRAGINELKSAASQFGAQRGASTVIIQGRVRTTGRYAGSAPSGKGEKGTGIFLSQNETKNMPVPFFLFLDPVGHAGDGYNFNRFCGNDPVNRTDPLGQSSNDDIDYEYYLIMQAPLDKLDLSSDSAPPPSVEGIGIQPAMQASSTNSFNYGAGANLSILPTAGAPVGGATSSSSAGSSSGFGLGFSGAGTVAGLLGGLPQAGGMGGNGGFRSAPNPGASATANGSLNTHNPFGSRTWFSGNQLSFILFKGFTIGFGQYNSVDAQGKPKAGHYFTYGTGSGIDIAAGITTGTTSTDAKGFAGPYVNTSVNAELFGATAMGLNGNWLGESANVGVGIFEYGGVGGSTTNTNTILLW